MSYKLPTSIFLEVFFVITKNKVIKNKKSEEGVTQSFLPLLHNKKNALLYQKNTIKSSAIGKII
jgi:hypothetical protein